MNRPAPTTTHESGERDLAGGSSEPLGTVGQECPVGGGRDARGLENGQVDRAGSVLTASADTMAATLEGR